MNAVPRHVLLVEDEPGAMITVSLLLEMMGYRVTQAANGKRALETLKLEIPDIVVTDYMMPHMNGIELIKAMQAEPAFAPVPVILTSAALPPEIDTSRVAAGFLSKPYRIDALVALIGRVLDQQG
ncbi:response regulator [Hydrocarboniphaga sp.]|uniref:response regulator n=1 Tax=Hydrocarboniphaga sp. TaxID=2033016 RepID=UPI003D10A985